MRKKLFFTLALLVAMLPAMANLTGTLGTCDYDLDSITGVLTISKTGGLAPEAYGYLEIDNALKSPFIFNEAIKKVVINEGVMEIGTGAFFGCKQIEEISFPSTCGILGFSSDQENVDILDKTQMMPFAGCTSLKTIEMRQRYAPDLPNYPYFEEFNEQTLLFDPAQVDIIVYDESVQDYKEHSATWGRFNIYTFKAIAGGSFGDGLQWKLSGNGKLTVTGKGAMPDFASVANAPWIMYNGTIKEIIIGEGITRVGNNSFREYAALESVYLPASLESIGDYAFYKTNGLTDITCAAIVVPSLGTDALPVIGGAKRYVYVWKYLLDNFTADAGWNIHELRAFGADAVWLTAAEVNAEAQGENTIYVTWPVTEGAKYYVITISDDYGFAYKIMLGTDGNVTYYGKKAPRRAPSDADIEGKGLEIKGLDSDKEYEVEVVAKDADDKELASAKAKVKTSAPKSKKGASPANALAGRFTVNAAGNRVAFSQGNLQYQASTSTWAFAADQYENIGQDNENVAADYDGWIDLFGWGTSGYSSKYPYMTSDIDYDYGNGGNDIAATDFDWGVYAEISNGGSTDWRTLTKDEWEYLLATRTDAADKNGNATVAGIVGLVLLPDVWTLPDGLSFTAQPLDYTTNSYSAEEWDDMQTAGAVFLPAAGRRQGTDLYNINSSGNPRGWYWTSTTSGEDKAYFLDFRKAQIAATATQYRSTALSVRLAADIPMRTVTFVDYDGTELKTVTVEDGTAATAPDDPTRTGYTFTGWDKDFSNVTEDMTVSPQYEIRKYTVTFLDYDGTELKTETVEHGGAATPPDDPVREGYAFTGWDKDFSDITSDLTVTAQYFELKTSGYCGPNLQWEYNSEKQLLTITGDGDMFNYNFVFDLTNDNPLTNPTPWYYYASKISTVSLPEGMTSIGNDAFGVCTSLSNPTIPSTVTSIGMYAFAGCIGMTNIILPNNLTTIGVGAFMATSISQITIPEGVTSIPLGAFVVCENLNKIVLPKNLASISEDAFSECNSLQQVYCRAVTPPVVGNGAFYKVNVASCKLYVPQKSVDAYKAAEIWKDFDIVGMATEYTVTFVDHNGTELKKETVEEGASATAPADPTREGYIFTGWDNDFTNVTSDLTVTAQYAVTSGICGKDGEGNLADNLTWSYDQAKKTLTIEGTGEMFDYKFYSDYFFDLPLTNPTPWYAFASTINLVSLPEGMTSIGNEAFALCKALTSINIPSTVKTIGADAFESCESLTSLTLPEGLTSISGGAFRDSGLESITIPDGITTIPSYAFDLCGNLNSVVLPKGLTSIGERAFEGCSITNLVLPEGTVSIDNYAFNTCNALKSITLPSSLASIGKNAFFFCTALSSVTNNAVTPQTIDADVFDEVDIANCKLYVLKKSLEAYNAAAVWRDFDIESITTQYTVTFLDYDGITILKEEKVILGEAATAPADPVREGYTFDSWDKDFSDITSDLTVTATYKINTYDLKLSVTNGWITVEDVKKGTSDQMALTMTWQFDYNTEVRLTVKGNDNYEFVKWEDGNTDNPRTVFVTEDMNLSTTCQLVHFTVIFQDKDGKQIGEPQSIEYGSTAEAPEAPVVEGYNFTGWEPDYTNVKSDLIVKATYEKKEYTVRFVDWNESEISSQTVKYGEAAKAPEDPVREGWTFTGWEPADFSQVKSDMNIVAQYSKDAVVYTVTFVDWNDELILAVKVLEGKDATPPADPEREGYDFIGWTGIYTNVQEDVVVKATYEIKYFTVTFVDWNGKTHFSQLVAWNESAYKPVDPYREGYTFTGWDKDFSHVTSDMTINAVYEINSYTVQFVDPWGVLIAEMKVNYGESAEAPEPPAIEGYTFVQWKESFSYITEDRIIAAVYNKNKYTVKFFDWDNTLLKQELVEYNEAATAPENPTRTGYNFAGWEPAGFNHVKSDMNIVAQYNIKTFIVQFIDINYNEISRQTVEYGGNAVAPDAPEVEGYDFTGWDEDFTNVTKDLLVKPIYEIKTFTVTFVDWDDKVLSEQTIDWGKAAKAPADPTREGWTFIGWEPADFSQVKSDMTVKAQYSKDAVVYTVTFVDYNDEVIIAVKVLEGEDAKAPADPVREGYKFTGWDKDFGKVTSDLTVKAQYEILTFSVVFLDKDGNELKKETVDYGKSATAPDAPAVEGYEFTGWDVDFSKVTSDLTVKALYKEVEAPDYTPQNLKVVVEALEDNDTKITFSWDAVEGADSYEIQLLYNGLSLFATNTYTLHEIPLVLSVLLEQITDLVPGTYQLDWQVRSLDAKGNAISDWADGEQFEIEVPIITGLENTGTHPSPDAETVKVLRNGRVVIILPNGREYDTRGARIE